MRDSTQLLLVFSVLILAGCGGSEPSIDQPDPVIIPELPSFEQSGLNAEKLRPANNDTFSQLVKNGVYVQFENERSRADSQPIDASASPSSSSTEAFSQTITQEIGVDEMDIMKFDGHHLYVVDRNVPVQVAKHAESVAINALSPAPEAEERRKTQIRILKKQTDMSLTEEAKIDVFRDIREQQNIMYPYLQGVYLHADQLLALGNGFARSSDASTAAVSNGIWYPSTSSFFVEMYNTGNIDTPIKTDHISIEGYLINSRRIDNQLMLVSSYWPTSPVPLSTNGDDSSRVANYTVIQETDINAFIPSITINDDSAVPLFSPEDCYIPEGTTLLDSRMGMVIITMINTDDPTDINAMCINGYYSDVYATTDSVFVHGQFNTDTEQESVASSSEATVIHHFTRDTNQFSYNGTASVSGNLGWTQANLRLDATTTELRVVSTQRMYDEEDRFDHYLSIFSLAAQGNELPLLSVLPNQSAVTELGKPNEDIRAVRYFADKAYLVTFEQIDPLYVLDVSQPTQPVVVGELEMPGYSSYLHPINANFILGIGQNVPVEGLLTPPNSTSDQFGAKIALFDVSSTPRIVNEYVFANSYSPAEFNYHALTYLAQSDTQHMFAMPMQSWTELDGGWFEDNRLELFNVDLTGNASMLNNQSVRTPIIETGYYGSIDDRAVIVGDVIYYVKAAQVWQTTLNDTTIVNGPY